MCRLCLRELHKFFHSRLHCALLCVLLLFPLLHLAFTLHAQTQERYALLNDKVLNAKEAKAIADDLRRSMSGTAGLPIESRSWKSLSSRESRKRIFAIKHWIRHTGTAIVPWKWWMPYDWTRRHLLSYDMI